MLARLRSLPYWQQVLWITFVSQFVSSLGFAVMFPFLPLYVQHLGTRTGFSLEFWAGMVYSAQAFTMMIASPFWGAVADRYGRKLMMNRALFGGTVVIGLMAFVTSAEQLVLLRAIQGTITGTQAAAYALVAAAVPRERTGYAMGLLQVGLWGGVAVGPILGGVLADAYGFRLPQLVTAALLFASGVMVQLFIREDLPQDVRRANQKKSFVGEWQHILAMPGVVPTYLISFFGSVSRTMISPVAPLYVAALMASSLGIGAFTLAALHASLPGAHGLFAGSVSTTTGLLAGVSSLAATVSAIYFGRLGDRIGHRLVLMLCAAAALVTVIPQVFVTQAWHLIALQGLTGLASGGLISAPAALLARFTTPGEEGAVYGLENSVVAGGRTLGPLMGALIAAWLGLRAAFALAVVIYALIVLVAVVLLPRRHGMAAAAESVIALPVQPEPAAGD